MHQAVFRFAMGLTRLIETAAAVLVGIAVTVNLAQVVYRRILGDPLEWSEEVMRYTMIWVAFLAGSAAVFRGEHMAAGFIGGIGGQLVKRVVRVVERLLRRGPLAARRKPHQEYPLRWHWVLIDHLTPHGRHFAGE